MTQTAKR